MDNANSNTSSTVVSGARVVCFLKIPMYLTSFSGCFIILRTKTPVHKIDANAGKVVLNAKFPQGVTLWESYVFAHPATDYHVIASAYGIRFTQSVSPPQIQTTHRYS